MYVIISAFAWERNSWILTQCIFAYVKHAIMEFAAAARQLYYAHSPRQIALLEWQEFSVQRELNICIQNFATTFLVLNQSQFKKNTLLSKQVFALIKIPWFLFLRTAEQFW